MKIHKCLLVTVLFLGIALFLTGTSSPVVAGDMEGKQVSPMSAQKMDCTASPWKNPKTRQEGYKLVGSTCKDMIEKLSAPEQTGTKEIKKCCDCWIDTETGEVFCIGDCCGKRLSSFHMLAPR